MRLYETAVMLFYTRHKHINNGDALKVKRVWEAVQKYEAKDDGECWTSPTSGCFVDVSFRIGSTRWEPRQSSYQNLYQIGGTVPSGTGKVEKSRAE